MKRAAMCLIFNYSFSGIYPLRKVLIFMAGRGPAPKDSAKRARRNVDPSPMTMLRAEKVEQPPLPKGYQWPAVTRQWWELWGESPQAEHFSSTDWDFLLDTALIHAAYWGDKDFKQASELRLRMAKFGATHEDRLRLRMQSAQTDKAEGKATVVESARDRRAAGGAKVVKFPNK